MDEPKQIVLPITGMTCANCVATIERNLKRLDGVSTAVVNLSSERATVEFDSSKLALDDIIHKVERAGYGVAKGEADFTLRHLSDSSDARRLEKSLAKLEGVEDVQVNLPAESVRLKYIPTLISQAEIRQAINKAGFETVDSGGDAEDAEAIARQAEIAHQKKLLIIGILFTLPLFLLSMGRDFDLIPSSIGFAPWMNWLMLVLATPVQFYVGCAVLRGGLQSPAQQIGQHGRADRYGFVGGLPVLPAGRVWLVAAGTSTWKLPP